AAPATGTSSRRSRRRPAKRLNDRYDCHRADRRRRDRDEAGLRGSERPAQGGQAARPGPGRVRGRCQAAQHGLPQLRPLALRPRETARDASELVEVDYEPLPPVTDARQALDDETPVLHDEAGTNLTWEGVYEWGDLDAAFAEADRVIKISELHFDRFNSTPLECDGALVEYNRGTGQWTLITNNQFPGFAVIMMG